MMLLSISLVSFLFFSTIVRVQSSAIASPKLKQLLHYSIYKYEYVHKEFRRNNCTIGKFISNDTGYESINYRIRLNVLWNNHSVCRPSSFAIILYLMFKRDYERRSFLRQHLAQGMIVKGKRIEYMFVVAVEEDNYQLQRELQEENRIYNDMLISLHKDNRANITITVLDALLWARDYCSEVSYVLKVDGDSFINLGNLVTYLSTVPRTRFYGGLAIRDTYRRRSVEKRAWYVPDDYPIEKTYYFNLGWGIILSNDLVPYIVIGTEYIDLLIRADDPLIGDILSRISVFPFGDSKGYIIACNHYLGTTPPNNIVFLHHLKNITEFKHIWNNFSYDYSNNSSIPS